MYTGQTAGTGGAGDKVGGDAGAGSTNALAGGGGGDGGVGSTEYQVQLLVLVEHKLMLP